MLYAVAVPRNNVLKVLLFFPNGVDHIFHRRFFFRHKIFLNHTAVFLRLFFFLLLFPLGLFLFPLFGLGKSHIGNIFRCAKTMSVGQSAGQLILFADLHDLVGLVHHLVEKR